MITLLRIFRGSSPLYVVTNIPHFSFLISHFLPLTSEKKMGFLFGNPIKFLFTDDD